MEGNNLFHERYFLERLLGRGNFSEVWLAKDTKTDIEVALKIYAPATGLDDAGLNVLAREFSIVVNANHKNLLKPLYYDSYERKPYLVLPFCKEGSILKRIGKFTEDDAWLMLRDVAAGLAFLHAMNPPIIHQDIKPDNIMVGEHGQYMITDFGVSTHVRSTLRKSMSQAFASAGTIAYMAPERFGQDTTPLMANDIYSLGATVFEMLTGDAPFGDDGGLMQKKGADIPQLNAKYSQDLRKVLTKCLSLDPWKRPTAEQLEKYAQEHIDGKPVRFVDEKTFMQKYGLVAGILGVVVVAGLVFMGIELNKAANERAAAEAQARQEAFNDSINTVARRLIATGDSLINVGDQKYENYELNYLRALDNYKLAEATGAQASPATITIDATKIEHINRELSAAHAMLIEKVDLFADMPELAQGFQDRADKIAKTIDVKPMAPADTIK
ncbi:MAG: serine/threonine-protein kinase [Bacteroidales bacterium]|nr:serine/threonine-protein kinase [Bacteroidales bacterium]